MQSAKLILTEKKQPQQVRLLLKIPYDSFKKVLVALTCLLNRYRLTQQKDFTVKPCYKVIIGDKSCSVKTKSSKSVRYDTLQTFFIAFKHKKFGIVAHHTYIINKWTGSIYQIKIE